MPTASSQSSDRIQIYYVHSKECLSCEQSWPLIHQAIIEASKPVDLTKYDIHTREGASFAKAHGIASVPSLVFDDGETIQMESYDDVRGFEAAVRAKLIDIAAHPRPITVSRNVTRIDPHSIAIDTGISCHGDRPVSVGVQSMIPEGGRLVRGEAEWNGVLQPGENRHITGTCEIPPGTRSIPPIKTTFDDGTGSREIVGLETPVIILQELSSAGVYLAGLIAGINPCLLAVLAFIGTTTISDTGRRTAVIWRIGAFCCGMLAVYLFIGVGLMELIKYLPFADRLLWGAIILLLLAMGCWSFIDAYMTGKGSGSTTFRSILDRIRPLYLRFGTAASFIVGGLFGLVKMPCVGGIYIAILGAILESGQTEQGLILLTIYNLGVITPVLLLGTLITVGMSPGAVNQFRLKHRIGLKVFTGTLLICMAIAFLLKII
ncbi:MAG TPA: cytochrome c biogenesis CcdA family protein [Methanocella sp.]|nr:cytochrome c biogenesis CcdA family protein [Methanocella sp.]